MADLSGAQSLERAFGLIDILAQSGKELPLHELAALSGLNKSTVHRILGALAALGYVKNTGGSYALTLKLFAVGSTVLDSMDITSIARPHLEQLRRNAQETIHLVTLDGPDIVYIQKLEYNLNAYQMSSRIGMRRPAYCTAAGKSILATLSDRSVAEIWEASEIKAYTDHTITDLTCLYAALDGIRTTGIAYDNEENELGMRCVASPIRDFSGSAKYALSVSAPLIRMTDARVSILTPMVQETSAAISAELGYTGTGR